MTIPTSLIRKVTSALVCPPLIDDTSGKARKSIVLLQLNWVLYEAVCYGEIFSRNICPKFLPTNILRRTIWEIWKSSYGSENLISGFHGGIRRRVDQGWPGEERKGTIFHWSAVFAFRILYHVCLFYARLAYYVHETGEIYMTTQLNLAKLTKEPSATYQICLWSHRGTKVNIGIETKNQLVICTNPATGWSSCIWGVTERRNIRQANRE